MILSSSTLPTQVTDSSTNPPSLPPLPPSLPPSLPQLLEATEEVTRRMEEVEHPFLILQGSADVVTCPEVVKVS